MTVSSTTSTKSTTETYTVATNCGLPAEIIAKAFQTNKINQYISLNAPYEENLVGFQQRVKQLIDLGSEAAVDDNESAAAVWIPPQLDYPKYNCELTKEAQYLEDEIERCSKTYLGDRPYWHLTFLGKDPEKSEVKGSVSKVVKPYLEKAIQDNVPAVLEAIDDRAKDIYLHYGFKILETFKVGDGHLAYYMVYNY